MVRTPFIYILHAKFGGDQLTRSDRIRKAKMFLTRSSQMLLLYFRSRSRCPAERPDPSTIYMRLHL